MNKKAYLVARRELVENMRTKAFWIGILVFPVIITLSIMVPMWLEKAKEAREYAVIDNSGWLLEAVEERATMPDLEKVFREALERYRKGGDSFEELPESLQDTARGLEEAMKWAGGQQLGNVPEEEREAKQQEIEETLLGEVAAMIAGITGPEGAMIRSMAPAETIEGLIALQESIRTWWTNLPPEEASEYGSRLAKGRYVRVDVDTSDIEKLNRMVEEEEIFAYLIIGEDPVEGNDGFKYVSSNLTDEDLLQWFSRLSSTVVREKRLEQKEIDQATATWIQKSVRFDARKVGEGGVEEEVDTQDKVRQWAPPAFVYMLWIAVFTVAQMLLTNTIEEKSNRIMEVLLSSVSPLELMTGKIFGIAATGLCVIGSWVFFLILAVKFVPQMMGANLDFDLAAIVTDPVYIGAFVVYFFLGYLLYASLLVGIGAVCNSLKEAQNLMMPVTIMLMIPLFAMMPIAMDPNGSLARILSFVPTFTPFVMMNRAAGPPATWEYVATTILLLVTIAAAFWAAAKVFRIGILMTGKPPKPMEILRWIKAPVGIVPERKE